MIPTDSIAEVNLFDENRLMNRLSELENHGVELYRTSSKIENKIGNLMEIIALFDKPTVGHPQDTRGENQQQRQGRVSLKYMVVPTLP